MAHIYTSYFAAWRQWPENVFAVGITRFKPDYWKGFNLENLAPSESLLRRYRNKEIDEYIFKTKYIRELKDRGLTPQYVRQVLETAANGRDIILCCYEKPDEFCHRHLLAEWLGGDGDQNKIIEYLEKK